MNRPISMAFAAITALWATAAFGDDAERQMNVRQGPEAVFAEEVGQIFAELLDATATGMNGRVGNELVFWSFRLEDGRDIYLVACAMLDDVDCAARENRVCPVETQVIARGTTPGLVREIACKSIATVAPGDRRPGCTEAERPKELAVSLVSCG